MNRIKNYLKEWPHKYIVVKDKVKNLHRILNTTTESQLIENWRSNDRTLYTMFIGWLLENIYYGLIISIALISFGVSIRWYYPVTIGLLKWVCLDLIKQITKVIRSKS